MVQEILQDAVVIKSKNSIMVIIAFSVVAPVIVPNFAHAGGLAPCNPNSASPVDSCIIDYGGTTYKISKTSTTSYSSAFPSPSVSELFWWGDQAKAISAATAVGSALGLPNTFERRPALGPYFAYSPAGLGPDSFVSAFLSSDPGGVTYGVDGGGAPGVFAKSEVYVPDAPGPFPALGAAAAFGFSRKLRKRINRSLGSASNKSTN